MDNGSTRLIVFLLGDPYLLEGGEAGKDGHSNPCNVFLLWGSNDLDLHGRRYEGIDFFLHSVGNAWVYCAASRQNGVSIQIPTDVRITLHDGVVRGLMIPADSIPRKEGWKRASGHWNRSFPTVTTRPSGSS